MSEPVQVPYSPNAEAAVIGSLLIDPSKAKTLDLSADAFYLYSNQMIYTAIRELADAGRIVDLKTVCTRLDERRQLAEVGGPAALMGIMANVTSTLALETHAETVRDRAQRRQAVRAAEGLVQAAFDLEAGLDVGPTIDALSKIGRSAGGAEHVGRWASMVYDDVDMRCKNPQDIYGFATGFGDLDRMTGGMQAKMLYIIAGEPATGKSLFAVQIGAHMARLGHPGAIYELEMPGEQLARREISAQSKIQTATMLRGQLKEDDWTPFTAAVEDFAALPIYGSDATNWTTTGIRADLSRLKALYGVEWALIDYLFLLSDLPGASEIERTNYVSRQLKGIAKDLGLVIIAIQSLTKTPAESGGPKMQQMRGSFQVAYDADDIWVMTRDENMPEMRWIYPVKARERDHLAKVKLVKVAGLPMFASVARDAPEPPRLVPPVKPSRAWMEMPEREEL